MPLGILLLPLRPLLPILLLHYSPLLCCIRTHISHIYFRGHRYTRAPLTCSGHRPSHIVKLNSLSHKIRNLLIPIICTTVYSEYKVKSIISNGRTTAILFPSLIFLSTSFFDVDIRVAFAYSDVRSRFSRYYKEIVFKIQL